MNLPKAIEILDRYFILSHNVPLVELNKAAKLLIEAGKRLQLHREHSIPGPMFLLPGETED